MVTLRRNVIDVYAMTAAYFSLSQGFISPNEKINSSKIFKNKNQTD
jgi:hypothetical protein